METREIAKKLEFESANERARRKAHFRSEAGEMAIELARHIIELTEVVDSRVEQMAQAVIDKLEGR